MTSAGCKFRMEVLSTDGLWFSAEYDSFSVASESNQYTLSIAGYSGDTGDIFLDARDSGNVLNGRPFSTPDRDDVNHHSSYQTSGWCSTVACGSARLVIMILTAS